jgi:dihydrofolate synthase / folylpolyglutamate synthase
MTFAGACRLLAERQEERIEFGLDRLRAALRRLGDPQERFPSILVAGTNGKGSTCALLEAALREAGYRTGLTTSPHLLSPVERIRLDGRPASEALFAASLSRVLSAEREPLSYFELVTAAAFAAFAEAGVEAAVLEVGLGGRLDATNVVRRPALSIITSIGYDHTAWLGPTLASIAREKAGIMRRGGTAVVGRLSDEPLKTLRREARWAGARLFSVGPRPPLREGAVDWRRGLRRLRGSGGPWRLALLGSRQADNASLVLSAARRLGRSGLRIPTAALRRAFETASWPGRFQLLRRGGRTWILDGAHNGEAAEVFAETWASSPFRSDGTFILGLLKDKDPEAVVAPLAPWLRTAVVCPPPSPRASEPERVAAVVNRLARRAKIVVRKDFVAARAAAERLGSRSVAVVGSFYLVGEALRRLGEPPLFE